MIKNIFVVLSCLVVVFAYQDYDIVEDNKGLQYYLVPIYENQQNHLRVRRQTSIGGGSDGLTLSHTGVLLDNSKHQLAGTAFANKPFPGPLTAGGSLDYLHKPSQSQFSLNGATTRGLGTGVGAKGTYNFFQSKNGMTSANVNGYYNRHFGGPGGTGRPDYGAFLGFSHRF